ncbi:hypothetical protein PVK06_045203 [Gossypium arboreum]|uniref:RNase H type-1 domain-containing protein n=1 Tax=Gossypium arboreum TaxID=29729 RepID=A0ABR0MTN2_GOSAR|nr:hypothetical protein PVK06_045203 [Gossypium arboreum]
MQLFLVLKADVKGSFKSTIEEESFEDPIFLNTDRAVQIEIGNAAADGIIRNANRDWILGYNRHLGKCSIFNAKLWGILEGLRLIQRRGHDEGITQSDSLEVVKAIFDRNSTGENFALIRRIQSILSPEKSILSPEKRWCLRYIPGDQNQVVDCLAKQALFGSDYLQHVVDANETREGKVAVQK